MPQTGPVAWLVNGVALYGVSDGASFLNANVWQSVAAEFAKYDVDVCNGQATNPGAQYHRKEMLST